MNFQWYDPHQIQILVSVAIAMLLGALIGLDREAADKPAGLRTHTLVAGAAALLVELGMLVIEHYQASNGFTSIRSDPIRIIEAVITGIAFLGAGTIIRHQSTTGGVEGLTTAASLLFASAVGIGVALSQWILVVGSTLLVLIILRGIPWIRGLFLRVKERFSSTTD